MNWFRLPANATLFPIVIALVSGLSQQSARSEPVPLSLPVTALITDQFIDNVRTWATAPVVIESLVGRNKTAGQLSQDEIDRLDKQWRSEIELDDQPLITSVLANPLSSYLTRIQANSVGVLTEVFVFDRNGLNAGQSSITSDYWQGDEAKFQKTFNVGAGAIFIDDPEYNEKTETWRAQLNMTIEGEDKTPIGAITVEVNLTELERRARVGLGS